MSDFDVEPDEGDPPGGGEVPAVREEFYVPSDQEEGVYAENVAIWHTAYGFVLDFGTYQLMQHVDPDDDSAGHVTPIRVVSRVRIPAGLAFDMIKTINTRMEAYEAQFGKIKVPGEVEGDE